jgi:hypothetical protein
MSQIHFELGRSSTFDMLHDTCTLCDPALLWIHCLDTLAIVVENPLTNTFNPIRKTLSLSSL